MPTGEVPLPHIDYVGDYIRIRVLHPDECEDNSFRTLDPGRPGHTQLVICRIRGEKKTTNQSLRLHKDDWKDYEEARKLIDSAFKSVGKRYGEKYRFCISGLSEYDKERFPEFVC